MTKIHVDKIHVDVSEDKVGIMTTDNRWFSIPYIFSGQLVSLLLTWFKSNSSMDV